MNQLIEVKSNWKDHELRIEYMIGNTCNFKCWYCFPGSHEGTHRWGDYSTTTKNFKHLIQYYKSNGKTKIYLHLIGGEPTLWPELGEFAKEMSEQGCYISISTNGSRTLRWWKDHAKYFHKVILSCHHQEMKLEHNIQVADILYEAGCIVDAIVLMDPNSWDKCVSIIEDLKNSKHKWTIIAGEIIGKTISYTEEQIEFIQQNIKRKPNLLWFFKNNKHHMDNIKVVFEDNTTKKVGSNWIRLNKHNSFYGWDCNLGKDSIYITKEGFITGTCNQVLYGLDNHFSIYDIDFTVKFNPQISSVICSKLACNCQAETNLKKRKIIPSVPILLAEYLPNRYTIL